jgi:hypothetical protein
VRVHFGRHGGLPLVSHEPTSEKKEKEKEINFYHRNVLEARNEVIGGGAHARRLASCAAAPLGNRLRIRSDGM